MPLTKSIVNKAVSHVRLVGFGCNQKRKMPASKPGIKITRIRGKVSFPNRSFNIPSL
jgi:hypothetical protein